MVESIFWSPTGVEWVACTIDQVAGDIDYLFWVVCYLYNVPGLLVRVVQCSKEGIQYLSTGFQDVVAGSFSF